MSRYESDWLKKAFNNLFSYLDEVFYINAGGCCFVAYVLAKKLESLKKEFRLVLYDDEYLDDTDSGVIRENIKSRNLCKCPNGDNTCSHYAIKVRNLGIINPSDFKNEKHVTIKDISSRDILWIYEQGEWNECYNPQVNDIIEKNIDLIFEAYERIFQKAY